MHNMHRKAKVTISFVVLSLCLSTQVSAVTESTRVSFNGVEVNLVFAGKGNRFRNAREEDDAQRPMRDMSGAVCTSLQGPECKVLNYEHKSLGIWRLINVPIPSRNQTLSDVLRTLVMTAIKKEKENVSSAPNEEPGTEEEDAHLEL
eukprot:24188_1